MLCTAAEYRESLRACRPRVYVAGMRIESVADAEVFAPGVNAIGVTYDLAHDPRHAPIMTAVGLDGATVNRMAHVDACAEDLLAKLEAVRLVCQESGCAQRYLTHDGLAALYQATYDADAEFGTEYHARLLAFLRRVQREDLTLGIAMTDAKGDRSVRPGRQPDPDAYVHISERRPDGVVLRGTKAIVTAAPYVHEFLVLPCRTMRPDEAQFAVAAAVPVDAAGVTILARPAGRPGERAATFSNRYGQSTGVVIFEDVFVPWERVFLAGEVEHAGRATTTYATHHRHTCIGARAGFGDLLVGAGALMMESNGLDPDAHPHMREQMVQLITIVEGFFACGVAASTYCSTHPSGTVVPEVVFANIGKLLLANQIYDMHRIAHYVSGGLIVALPEPGEDHNPDAAASLDRIFAGGSGVDPRQRRTVSRLIEDLTASYQGGWYSLISLHGGGSPEAMKREIWRHYPVPEKTALVANLIDRGIAGDREPTSRQPGKCCATGCLGGQEQAGVAELVPEVVLGERRAVDGGHQVGAGHRLEQQQVAGPGAVQSGDQAADGAHRATRPDDQIGPTGTGRHSAVG
jgi:4-hydroxybutyryl-CoA dehydratase / vinylacetyl-CoA-Delta-isomerase